MTTTPGVLVTCPNCGGPVAPVVLDPATAPWLCAGCQIGWWAAELDSAVRGSWSTAVQSFDPDLGIGLAAAVDQEQAAAVTRGTSVRADQLALLPAAVLTALAGRAGLAADLVAAVGAALAAMGSS